MNILVKTIGFSLVLTAVFTLVTRLLPQVQGDAPEEKKVDLATLTMDDFVALGEQIFMNKGTCTLCHKPPPLGRAPDIQNDDMVETAKKRLADSRYKGQAKSAEEYIRESMVDPSAYVVSGWGKKGTNDTESPMPSIDKPPIELSGMEVDAVVAWLQVKDGHDVTVPLPSAEAASEAAAATPAAKAVAPASAKNAEEAIAKHSCAGCHALDSKETLVGPGLAGVGARLTLEEIRQSILDPNAVVTEGFVPAMPTDFAEKMTVRELEMVVKFLAEKK